MINSKACVENWGSAWLTSRSWTTHKVQRQKNWATLTQNLWEKALATPFPTRGNIVLICAILLYLLNYKLRLKAAAFTFKSLYAAGSLFFWSSNQHETSGKCLSKVRYQCLRKDVRLWTSQPAEVKTWPASPGKGFQAYSHLTRMWRNVATPNPEISSVDQSLVLIMPRLWIWSMHGPFI